MKKIILFIMLLWFSIANLNATTYYVNCINGHDYNSGLSEELAWQTIEKVDTASSIEHGVLNPGDQILFKRGCTWTLSTTPLLPTTSGSEGSLIIYGAYGTGDKPVIDGNNSVICLDITTQGDYTTPPAINYISFQDLKFTHGGPTNINIWNCSYITFESCDIDGNSGDFIDTVSVNVFVGQGSNVTVRNCKITNTTVVFGARGEGIYLDGVDSALVENTVFDGGCSGIRIGFGSVDDNWPGHTDNLTVRYCTIKNQLYDCIDDDGAVNSQFYYNSFESSKAATFHEILYIFSPQKYNAYVPHGNSYFNNTFITHIVEYNGGYTMEINTSDATANNLTFKNNLFYTDNISDDTTGYIFVNRTNPGTWNFDNNIYYLSGGGYSKAWIPNYANNTTPLPGFASWQAYGSHNYDVQSKIANPSFTNFADSNYSLQNSSPAALSGVWVNLPAHDIVGNPIGNPTDIGAYQKSTYWKGQISSNQTMSGSVAITDSLNVAQNCTLTVAGGTHIKVENGSNIKINGKLQCDFDSLAGNIIIDTILTNNKKGYIIFDGPSDSTSGLNHVSIRQAGGIQCINGANVLIKNSRLDTCFMGIYFYNSAPNIINNTITDPVQYGISGQAFNSNILIKGNVISQSTMGDYEAIFLLHANHPYVEHNDVSGFEYGIYVGCGSTCYFYDLNEESPFPNNRFMNNDIGIGSAWGSLIMVGDNNTTMNNASLACLVYQNSRISAGYDYWGPGNIVDIYPFWVDTATGSSFEWGNNYLTSDPWGSENSTQKKSGGQLASNKHLSKSMGYGGTENDSISAGFLLENSGRIDEAISFYKGLIASNKYVRIALSQLAHIKYKYSRNELSDYFGNLLLSNPEHYANVKRLLGDMHLQNNQFDNAMTAYNDVIRNYPTEYDGISARFSKLFAYLHIKKDPATAYQILSEIKGLNSNEKEVRMRIKSAESLLSGNNKVLAKNSNLRNDNTPKTYSLSQNFPNPFNPSTTIRYQIPKPGLVTLKVFDILGREVATLVNENKIEGSYDFSFNASRFASGVYVYQLRVNDYVSSKKMILLK